MWTDENGRSAGMARTREKSKYSAVGVTCVKHIYSIDVPAVETNFYGHCHSLTTEQWKM